VISTVGWKGWGGQTDGQKKKKGAEDDRVKLPLFLKANSLSPWWGGLWSVRREKKAQQDFDVIYRHPGKKGVQRLCVHGQHLSLQSQLTSVQESQVSERWFAQSLSEGGGWDVAPENGTASESMVCEMTSERPIAVEMTWNLRCVMLGISRSDESLMFSRPGLLEEDPSSAWRDIDY